MESGCCKVICGASKTLRDIRIDKSRQTNIENVSEKIARLNYIENGFCFHITIRIMYTLYLRLFLTRTICTVT